MQPRNMLTKPQIERLKALSHGMAVEHVMGERVLVKPVTPKTDMDRLEQEGLLFMPEDAKEVNTPLPSVGVIMQRGTKVSRGNLVQRGLRLWVRFLQRLEPDREHNHPMPADWDRLEPGIGVMFSPFAGSDWAVENEEFRVLEVREIMCTLSGLKDVVVPVRG